MKLSVVLPLPQLLPSSTSSDWRLDARAEEPSAKGRADEEVMVSGNIVYIIELKLDKSADEALSQIKEKKYYEKYVKKGNKIHLLGINFSSKERNITDWKEEILG